MSTPQPSPDLVDGMEKAEAFLVKYGVPKRALPDMCQVVVDLLQPVKARGNGAIEKYAPNWFMVGGYIKHEGETLLDGAIDDFGTELLEAAEVAAVNA